MRKKHRDTTLPLPMTATTHSLPLLLLFALLITSTTTATTSQQQHKPNFETHIFGFPFNSSYYDIFSVQPTATISNEALQITPDSAGNFTLANRAGRIFYNQPFLLWQPNNTTTNQLASFNTTFILNIFRLNTSTIAGEGVAFVIAPNPSGPPPSSSGEYLGLTNSTTDGESSNHLFAVEFDTHKQSNVSDPDDNHVGVNINSIRSNKTTSLKNYNITLAPNTTVFHKIWINYDGNSKTLKIYMTELYTDRFQSLPIPTTPILQMTNLDLSSIINQRSYFGFSASTGTETQELHCVLSWNITVELIGEIGGVKDRGIGTAAVIGVVVACIVVLMCGVLTSWWYWKRGNSRAGDPNILGALKSLPGTPREFEFKDLRKATGNFDEKGHKLGQGGYGVVFKGYLASEIENGEVAVKRFSRDDIHSKDDFLSELTIINRLRHRHLVKLLGWCHKNGMLLIVYEYLPNGSLDKHIFCNDNQKPLNWQNRYKILRGVASALHYLHHEFESTVIHRDLKASNIMLDHNFNARLGDFGLARALDQEKTSYAELEGVHGTMGYIAPECFHTGKATRESDIYGLGAVFLEVATGHRPWTKLDGYNCLVDWVWSLHRERRLCDAVDPRLGSDYLNEEAERVLLLGLACSHPMANERPKTQRIVQVLSGTVPSPEVSAFKPAFMWPAMGPMGIDMSLGTSTMTADTTQVASSAYGSEWTPRSDGAGGFNDWTPRSDAGGGYNGDTY